MPQFHPFRVTDMSMSVIVYDFTFNVRCRCQYVLERYVLTANHEWQIITMVDTQMPRSLRTSHTFMRFALTANGRMVKSMQRSELVAIVREWSAGDYSGIITLALCTRDLRLICN